MAPPQTVRLIVEYDGTPYCGWQAQHGQASVQQALADALSRFVPERQEALRLNCAGRTDAGVHAYGQVVSFVTASSMEARRLAPALNRYLPSSIRVHHSARMPAGFHARFDARANISRYRLYRGPHPLALDRRRAWRLPASLQLEPLRAAAATLVGSHDFNAFRSAHCDAEHARRDMHAVTVTVQRRPPLGDFIDVTYEANAFCRHMCRILTGTLVEVGLKKRSVAQVTALLRGGRREAAGMTAPPWGLTLLEVLYNEAPANLQPAPRAAQIF